MSALELRPLQAECLEKVRQRWRGGATNVLVQAPCGMGKTEMSVAFLAAVHENQKRGAFICDRISLVNQTGERFDKYELPHGVIQADHWRWQPWQRIQLCSIQTLRKRDWPDFDLTVIDECHVLTQGLRDRLLRRDRRTIGLTATPFTPGLGKYFDAVVNAATTYQLMRLGWLVPFTVFEPSVPDMTGVKVVAGEWEEEGSTKAMLPIIGDCVAEYLKHGQGKKFIAFAVSVASADEMCKQFQAAGIVAMPYTYRQTDDEKKNAVDEFRKSDSYIRGLVSVESLTRGFDVADVEVLILARPLRKSLTTHLQMLGRVLRPSEGKECAIVLDHAGNCRRFWGETDAFFDAGVEELDDGSVKKKKPAKAKAEVEPKKCPRCKQVHAPRPACPHCGFEYPRKVAQHVAGELVTMGMAGGGAVERTRFHSELLWMARERGYKEGWAAWAYKERFGHWPPRVRPPMALPSADTLAYIRARQVKQARIKQNTKKYADGFAAL